MWNDGLRHGTATAWCGRLLFAALLFGVLTMHTFGHPAAHDGRMAAVAPHAEPAAHVGHAPAPAGGHGMPMHPTSVCLAVLGTAVLALFGVLAAVVLRARRYGAGSSFPAGRLPGPVPRPPPAGRALLSRLSVLRV